MNDDDRRPSMAHLDVMQFLRGDLHERLSAYASQRGVPARVLIEEVLERYLRERESAPLN